MWRLPGKLNVVSRAALRAQPGSHATRLLGHSSWALLARKHRSTADAPCRDPSGASTSHHHLGEDPSSEETSLCEQNKAVPTALPKGHVAGRAPGRPLGAAGAQPREPAGRCAAK